MSRIGPVSISTGGRVIAALVGAALIACCQSASGAFAQSGAPLSANACRSEPDPFYRSVRPRASIHIDEMDDSQLSGVQQRCGALIDDTSIAARDLRNAIYYFGAASRRRVALAYTTDAFAPQTLTPEQRTSLQRAEEALQRAIALDPDFSYARLELARIYRLQRRHDAALEQVEHLQRGASNPSQPVHAAAHFIRAALFLDDHHEDLARMRSGAMPLPAAQTGRTGAAPTLTWESTLTDLSVFTDSAQGADAEHRLREHPDRRTALNWLADYGRDLACLYAPCEPTLLPEVWDERPFTRENIQHAIDYLTLAQSGVDVLRSLAPNDASTTTRYVRTYSDLGAARTLMAGVQGTAGAAAFGCAPGLGNTALLAQAETDLQRATPQDGNGIAVTQDGVRDALVRLACVRLAQGQTDRAYADASLALDGQTAGAPENGPRYLMRGRIRVAQGDRTGAIDDFRLAAESFAPTAQRARSIAYLARALARFEDGVFPLTSAPLELNQLIATGALTGTLSELGDDLRYATDYDQGNWAARVERGKFLYDGQDFEGARGQLETFEFLGDGAQGAPRAVRAQGLLYLSKVETISAAYANADHAIRHADEALSLNGDWPYREQACLARLRFNRVAFPGAGPRAVCSALEGSPSAEASLVEGMYHLRRAFVVRGGERIRAWEDAYRAFTTGLAAIDAAQQGDDMLRARLLYGQGTAQYCIGFAEIGSQTINALDERHAAAEAYFTQYNINTCPPRR